MFERRLLAHRQFWIAGITLLAIILLWRPIASLADSTSTTLNEDVYLPLIIQSYTSDQYAVIGWNDLGMHCYNRDFQDLAVLPPYNTLWAQVIKIGDPPEIITSGIEVSYAFAENTYSVGKTNFWDYDLALFQVDLPDDVGLTGKGLSGEMELAVDHFIAEGIPLTEFNDNDHNTRQPYQLADIIVTDLNGIELARNQVVAPVSSEMRCDNCHDDGAFDISTGRVGLNILTLHDDEHQSDYPSEKSGPLVDRRPILCAECHATNALGAPGVAGIPNLSHAMHDNHAEQVSNDLTGCYQCHPGPETRCLRDVMSSEYDMDCIDCHGGMETVSHNPDPWLKEPRCDECHTEPGYQQDQALYRFSKGHGGLYCEACHDSTHAIAASAESRDGIKFVNLQGHTGTLDTCSVCHRTPPEGEGPHE